MWMGEREDDRGNEGKRRKGAEVEDKEEGKEY